MTRLLAEIENRGDAPDDLREWRREEQQAEMPVLLCCPEAAGMRVVQAGYSGLDPDHTQAPCWFGTYHAGGSPRATRTSCCAFCGTPVPKLVLRDPPLPHQCIDGDYQCCRCNERFRSCLCATPESAWVVENAPPVFAAVMLIPGAVGVSPNNDMYLSVSRRDDPNDIGLPGGKLEPGETPEEAAIRETQEETSVEVENAHLVFDAVSSHGRRVMLFRATKWKGEPRNMGSGEVTWQTMTALTSEASSFRRYYRSFFASLGFIHR